MKLALIFLSALVAITHQQFHQQHPSERPWWSSYSYTQLPRIVADRREIYYNNFQDDIPSIRRFRPARPVSFFPQSAQLDPSFIADEYFNDDYFNAEEEFPDTHSRKKVSEIRYRPISNKVAQQQQQRYFLNYFSNFNSILTQTVTFTLTSTVNQTSVKSCIAAANFLDAAAQTTPCRRKRDILEDAQFAIAPSETQRVMPTALPSLDVIRENRQLPAVDDQISGSMSSVEHLRGKRFWKQSVTSVTVTAYNFLSTTVITKAVNIGAAAAVLCLPSGWAVC